MNLEYVGRSRPGHEFDPWDERVVVDEVLADERFEPGEGVEGVQVEPALSELAPKRFDSGVRLDDVDLAYVANPRSARASTASASSSCPASRR